MFVGLMGVYHLFLKLIAMFVYHRSKSSVCFLYLQNRHTYEKPVKIYN